MQSFKTQMSKMIVVILKRYSNPICSLKTLSLRVEMQSLVIKVLKKRVKFLLHKTAVLEVTLLLSIEHYGKNFQVLSS